MTISASMIFPRSEGAEESRRALSGPQALDDRRRFARRGRDLGVAADPGGADARRLLVLVLLVALFIPMRALHFTGTRRADITLFTNLVGVLLFLDLNLRRSSRSGHESGYQPRRPLFDKHF
jgi:hypothetical protein